MTHQSDLEVKLPPREVGDFLPAPREHLSVPRRASRSLRQPYEQPGGQVAGERASHAGSIPGSRASQGIGTLLSERDEWLCSCFTFSSHSIVPACLEGYGIKTGNVDDEERGCL